nr:zinc finger, CCHC-type [Tanacetum cinerariifolium]
RMASMNTRLNIEKLDGNIVQKHGGSKQIGFKQLGPGVEIGVHGVHDEKHVWFEVELHGAQGDCEAEVFQVSNDDAAVAQRWFEDKQPEEKTNTNCLRSTQQYMKSGVAKHLGVAGIQQHNGFVDETNVTLFVKVYIVNRSPSSAIGFKKHIDMLGVFGWLASIKQGMLEPVKVKCIFLGYHKSIVRNKFWRLDEVTSKMCMCSTTIAGNAVTKAMAITGSIHQQREMYLVCIKDQSGNTLRVSQSRIYNEKLVHTLLKGHSTLSLEDSLSGDCDVEKNGKWSYIYEVGIHEYQVVCTRPDIASAGVGSLKANLQHMEALSTTEAGYMMFTEA